MAKIIKMGLTGGIASGKSEVGRLLSLKGIPVIDMDKIGRTLLESDSKIKEEIVAIFGNKAMSEGSIDREKLRSLVFTDPQSRKQLEQIVQPRIRKRFQELAQKEEGKGTRLVVCEAALLIESGYRHDLDKLTVVMAPEKVRMDRLLSREPVSKKLAEHIFQAQTQDLERLAVANYLVENTGSLEDLAKAVDELVAKWKNDGLL
ncbi:dephospho-CoA kinase [bacterium]|nr:dephospho-CoA kinase [bacterium]